jgi:hypothetical protein
MSTAFLIAAGTLLMGAVTGGLALLLAVPPLLALRALRQPADVIVGRRRGHPRRAPDKGSPPVSLLDTTAPQPEPTP